MAYILCDPFDNYTDFSTFWDTISPNTTGLVMSSAQARFTAPSPLTGQGVKFIQNQNARKNLPSTITHGFVNVSFFCPSMSGFGAGNFVQIFDLQDTGTIQLALAYTSTGALQFYRGTPATNAVGAASAPGLVVAGSYNNYEAEFIIDGTVGIVKLWMNQASGATPIINSTGLNTKVSANAFINQIRIGGITNAGAEGGIKYDDLLIFDNTGSAPNSQIGDQRLLTKMPSAAGSSSQWTDTGSTGAGCVNSIPPDATKYIADSTAGHVELYTMQSASLTVPANLVVIRRQHLKTDAGAHTDQSKIKSGAATAVSTAVSVPSTAAYIDDIYVNDPNTSAAWSAGTAAAADSIEVGVVETS